MAKRIPCCLFVTGTDTGVGKTQITAALVHLLTECNAARYLADRLAAGLSVQSGLDVT